MAPGADACSRRHPHQDNTTATRQRQPQDNCADPAPLSAKATAWTEAAGPQITVNNQLLIALARPDATFVAGFRSWLELGYQVGKGEKAIWILAPLKIKERDRVSGEETGETRTLFRAVPVFDRAYVTAGEHAVALEPPVEPLSGDSHEHLLEPLERFAGTLGFTVTFETIDGPAGGWV
jgi:hypothetical protein